MNIPALLLWHLCLCVQAAAALDNSQSRHSYNQAIDNGTYGYYPIRTYETEAALSSPRVNWLQWSPQCDDALFYFITPRGWSLSRPGPMILDHNGELVWTKHFDNDFGGQAYDFKVQRYQDQDYLTFWLGDDTVRGHGAGVYHMLNSSYDVVHTIDAVNGLSADLHEFLITPQGTALMTMYEVIPLDVTALRDFDPEDEEDQAPNYVWDCIFQEISLDTDQLIFQWRASDHLNLTDTYHDIGSAGTNSTPFDWFHMNSVSKDESGNYVVSARYTHSITYVDGDTGEILWILGGKQNHFMDLSDGFGLNFAWQHDARFHPLDAFPDIYTPPEPVPGRTTRLLTMFDNAAEDQNYEYGIELSRGLLLEVTYPTSRPATAVRRQTYEPDLDLHRSDVNEAKVAFINGTDPAFTVRVVRSYENPRKVRSSSQGSLQVLPSHSGGPPKVFVGYGLNAVWTEFDSNGTVLCDAHFGAETSWERGDIQSYRAYKFAWSGWPTTRPAIEISDDDVEVYISWNGATEVVAWILQGSEVVDDDNDDDGDDDESWAEILLADKRGFETVIELPDTDLAASRYLRVLAVGASGRVLEFGTSDILDRGYLASDFPLVESSSDASGAVVLPSPVKTFVVLIVAVVVLVAAYDVCRRLLSWRSGRRGAGPLRWRKGGTYSLLSSKA